MPLGVIPVYLLTLFPGGFHRVSIVMTKSALRTRNPIEPCEALMFGVTDGAGAILDHVELVKIVTHQVLNIGLLAAFLPAFIVMALGAVLVDGFEIDPSMKTVVQVLPERHRSWPAADE